MESVFKSYVLSAQACKAVLVGLIRRQSQKLILLEQPGNHVVQLKLLQDRDRTLDLVIFKQVQFLC